MSPLALLAVSLAVTESAFSCTYGSHNLTHDTICLDSAPGTHELVCEIGGNQTSLASVTDNILFPHDVKCSWDDVGCCYCCYAVPKGSCRGGRYLVYNLTDGKLESAICTEVPSSAAAPATRHEATPGSPRRVPSSTATPATKDPPGPEPWIVPVVAVFALIAVVVGIVLWKCGKCTRTRRDATDDYRSVPRETNNPQDEGAVNGPGGGEETVSPLQAGESAQTNLEMDPINPESPTVMGNIRAVRAAGSSYV